MSQATALELTVDITAKLDIAICVGEAYATGVVGFDAVLAICNVIADDDEWTAAETQGTQWILPIQDNNTVTKAARTLDLIRCTHATAAAAAHLTSDDCETLAAAACRVAFVLERAFDSVKRKLLRNMAGPEPGGAAPLAAVTAVQQQLTAEHTLRVMADAAGYVREHIWPAAMVERAAELEEEASTPLQPARRVTRGITVATLALSRDCSCAGARLAGALASCVRDALEVCAASTHRQRSPDPRAAARLVTALHDSGALEALCAAVLAAPPCPYVPPDAAAVNSYTAMSCNIIWNMVNTLQLLAFQDLPFAGCASALLSSPAVQRMRWALLEQVAASAPGGTGELLLPRRGGEAEQGGQEKQPSGGGGGSCSGARRRSSATGVSGASSDGPLWPFFQRHVLRLLYGPDIQLTAVLVKALEAALPGGDLGLFAALARLPRGASRPAYMPSVPQTVALAARVVRALCARAEYLGESGTVARNDPRQPPLGSLSLQGRRVESATEDLLRGATEAEVAACAPDLMAMYAWQLRLLATPMGLVKPGPEAAGSTLTSLWLAAAGAAPAASGLTPLPYKTAGVWKRLSPAGRAACVRNLLPTRLMRSLACLLRAGLAGGQDDSALHNTLLNAIGLADELLLPLLRAKQLEVRTKQQRASPERSGVGDGSCEVQDEWDPQQDLGLLVTVAKVMRQELAGGFNRMGALALPLVQGPWAMACSTPVFVVCGRPPETLTEQERAGGRSGGIVAFDAAPGGRVFREVGALVCRHALPLMARMLERSADTMQRCADPAALVNAAGRGGFADLSSILATTEKVTTGLLQALRGVPPSALLPAQPQRVAAALGRVVQQAERLLAAAGPRANAGNYAPARQACAFLRGLLAKVVTLLACDRELQAACPGWVWGATPRGCMRGLDLEALAAAAASPTLTPPRPVLFLPVLTTSPFLGWRWEHHAKHNREVVALARSASKDTTALPAWAQGAGAEGDDDAPLWPPRRVRMCGNPRCGNFSGPAEAGLDFKTCGGCRVMRYCGAACQKEHWGQGHKEECRRG